MTGLISILNLRDVKNVACDNLHNEPVSVCVDGAVLRMAAGRGTEEDRAGNERHNALHTIGGREDPIPGIKSIRNCEKSELISIFCGLDIKNGAGGA
jgi:hypothetical protein